VGFELKLSIGTIDPSTDTAFTGADSCVSLVLTTSDVSMSSPQAIKDMTVIAVAMRAVTLTNL